MKVLKEGSKDKVECNKCGSLLQFNDSDVRLHPRGRSYDDDFDDPEDRYSGHIFCAVCNHQILVDTTAALRRQLLARSQID